MFAALRIGVAAGHGTAGFCCREKAEKCLEEGVLACGVVGRVNDLHHLG